MFVEVVLTAIDLDDRIEAAHFAELTQAANLGQHLRSFNDAGVVVGVHIDKAWRQAQSFTFDGLVCCAMDGFANLNNAPITECNVATPCIAAAAVEHVCIAYECVALQHFG